MKVSNETTGHNLIADGNFMEKATGEDKFWKNLGASIGLANIIP